MDELGSPEEVLARLNSLKINEVCLKYHDGYGGSVFKANFLKYAPILKSAGVIVGAWGYNYFNYVNEEVKVIIEALDNGVDYYIFDGEDEIEGKQNETEQAVREIRNAKPNAILGYAPFPYASCHPNYPYQVFDKYCNFVSPQCYSYEIGTSLKVCIDKTLSDFKNKGLKLPIYPSFEAYKIIDYSSINSYNLKNYGFWALDEMDATCENFINSNAASKAINGSSVSSIKNNYNTSISSWTIKKLQENLNTLIKAGLVVDGIIGPLTIAATMKFQGIMGLVQDGIAGKYTNGAIYEIFSRPLDGVKMPCYKYATRWIQWRVGASIDGIYGNDTAAKVRQFQTFCNDKYRAKLEVDGIVGPMTWKVLFKF